MLLPMVKPKISYCLKALLKQNRNEKIECSKTYAGFHTYAEIEHQNEMCANWISIFPDSVVKYIATMPGISSITQYI